MKDYSSKAALLEAIRVDREGLEQVLSSLTPAEIVWPGAMGEWSVKDIMAHVVDWEQRLVSWYEAGRRGEVPERPAPGMTWRDLPLLNQQGFERSRNRSLRDVLADFRSSYQQAWTLVQAMTDAELLTRGHYAWTGKGNLASVVVANTCERYRWAQSQIHPHRIRQDRAKQGVQ